MALFVRKLTVLCSALLLASCVYQCNGQSRYCTGQFFCSYYNCIPHSLVCDGNNDCGNYRDEYNCHNETADSIRLASSSLGPHAGRVEVLYNGTWGSVCYDGWSGSTTSRTICRMLGYSLGRICQFSNSNPEQFGNGSGPVWISHLSCPYYSSNISECSHSTFRPDTCDHSRDAVLICEDPNIIPVADIYHAESNTTKSVSLYWTLPFIPAGITTVNFNIYYGALEYYYYYPPNYRRYFFASITYRVQVSESSNPLNFNYTVIGLTRNKTYEMFIQTTGRYEWCYSSISGNFSNDINITTKPMAAPSTLPTRLIPPDPSLPFIGRLEVYHNGEWGSVCDDFFRQDDADVACAGLNYTGAICYATSGMPRGSGPFWLDNLDCAGKDRLEDCEHPGWGVTNCRRSDEVGLICRPDDIGEALKVPVALTVNSTSPSSITLQWEPLLSSSILSLQITYGGNDSYRYSRYVTVSPSLSRYTLNGLQYATNYSIQFRPVLSLYSEFRGNCYSRFYGDYNSEVIFAKTTESAPTAPPSRFHISILNSTAVEATWLLPPSNQLNGYLQGFKIFLRNVEEGRSDNVINVDSSSREYIIGGLKPRKTYSFSILAYTIADGPRGIYLTVVMPAPGTFVTISQFGIYGDSLEAVRRPSNSRGFNVLCSSSVQNSSVYWQFSNGTRVGLSNFDLREGSFQNGTAVLQIKNVRSEYPYSRLSYCDGGVYTCVVTSPSGVTHMRNFSLTVGYSAPRPNTPQVVKVGSTWVSIGWEGSCDGGYGTSRYDVERSNNYYYYFTSVGSIPFISSSSHYEYTLKNLIPSTQYRIRVTAYSKYSSSTRSYEVRATTLPPGPSPPRNVSAIVTETSEVFLTWNPPSSPNGVVQFYVAYAEVSDKFSKYFSEADLPNSTLSKTFLREELSGTMTMEKLGLLYHFQMAAVILSEGELVEGMLSVVTSESTVYVPLPDMPMAKDLSVDDVTNNSISLSWHYPTITTEAIVNFKVLYSGRVEWTSPNGLFVHFQDEGERAVTETSLTVSSLVPSTSYLFKVFAVSQNGMGAELRVEATTEKETGEKLAYFKLMLSDVGSCRLWTANGGDEKLSNLKNSVASTLESLCQCGFTSSHIGQGELSCGSGRGVVTEVSYRARLTGTGHRSASDLVGLLDTWVKEGHASMQVGQLSYQLDGSCSAELDNIRAEDCDFKSIPTFLPPLSPTSSSANTTSASEGGGAGSAVYAAVGIGGLAAGILLTVIIVGILIIVMLCLRKKRVSDREFSGLMSESSSARNSVALDEKL